MRHRFVIAALILIISLGAGALASFEYVHHRRDYSEIEVTAAHGEFQLALSTMSLRLASMAQALEMSPELSPDVFSQIYNDVAKSSLRIHERALALMPEFATEDEAQVFMDRMSPRLARSGYPAFRLFPAREAQAIFPAVFVEPPASRSNVFGYNMGSSPERLAAARDALQNGIMTASAPVVLSQDEDARPSSFLLLYPVDLSASVAPEGEKYAVLGAGLTPAALFQDHVNTNEGLILEVDVRIGEQTLPVTLGEPRSAWMPRIPLLRDRTLPEIMINGLEISLIASVFYIPRPMEALFPLAVIIVTALLIGLIARVLSARETYKRNLEHALILKEQDLSEAYQARATSQRVEALGRLVGGVAHDFNNILSVILGNLELIKDKEPRKADHAFVDDAILATHRGAHLTRQLLSVGRKSHLQPRAIDVTDALEENARLLRRVLPETIEVTTLPNPELWTINIDPDGLQNAFLNIALNARDAMDGRGRLIFEAANKHLENDPLNRAEPGALKPGRYVRISIADTGSGIAPEIMDRVFDPFFSTKPATEGSGLGLSSVLGFCQQSGGTCLIESREGVGTTLVLMLPASDVTPGDGGPEAVKSRPASRAQRILLAEDEDSVAKVLIRQLEAAGHHVTRVATGDKAWSELQENAGYDLLISDLVMPGELQGAALARQAEEHRPSMAILLISGYPQGAEEETALPTERYPVLIKPVSQQALNKAIGRLLADQNTD
ncbi:MAG: CHASE domain-containing protein [Pseudomonadota bacterium]